MKVFENSAVVLTKPEQQLLAFERRETYVTSLPDMWQIMQECVQVEEGLFAEFRRRPSVAVFLYPEIRTNDEKFDIASGIAAEVLVYEIEQQTNPQTD